MRVPGGCLSGTRMRLKLWNGTAQDRDVIVNHEDRRLLHFK
jgi:hypothetical protein